MKMNNRDRIAVIIINYNSWQQTIDCLNSIDENIQNKKILKVFLVENGSTNDSRKQLLHYLNKTGKIDVEYIISDENKGFSVGNNLGLSRALDESFGYIMILNNDTIINDDIFSASINFFKQNDNCSLIALHTVKPDGQKELYCTRRRPTFFNNLFLYHTPFWNKKWFPGYNRHYMLDMDCTKQFDVYAGCGACMAFKREYFDKTGLFDSNTFLYSEEYIIAERATQKGFVTLFMPEPKVIHLGGQSTSGVKAFSFIEYCKSEMYLLQEYYGYGLVKRIMISAIRILNFLFKCTRNADYRKNLYRFIKIYTG